VVVTAQRRNQAAQEIGVAPTAVTAEVIGTQRTRKSLDLVTV